MPRSRQSTATGSAASPVLPIPVTTAAWPTASALWNDAARHRLETSTHADPVARLVGLGWLLVVLVPAALVVARAARWAVESVPLALLLGAAAAVAATLLLVTDPCCSRALGRARWWRPPYAG